MAVSETIVIPEPPYRSPVVSAKAIMLSVWLKWCELLGRALNSSPRVLGYVTLSGLHASIAATSFATPVLAAGLYRVSVTIRPSTAATVSSSIIPFLTATQSGQTTTQTPPYALTANDVTVPATWMFFQRIDTNTVLKYGTTYASVGATAMVYQLDAFVEQVPVPA